MNLARAADRRARVLVGARAPFRAPADSVDYAPLELARLELTGTTSLGTEPTTESRLGHADAERAYLLLCTRSRSGAVR